MSGETLQVYFLGTAGALPTPERNPPCIMIRRGSDTLLFDCGEGCQQQMMRARTGFTVDAVFVTHWHADHFLGIFGLVQTMAFMGREAPLVIYGPEGVHKYVEYVRNMGKYSLRFPVDAVCLDDGDTVDFDGYSVHAFSTDHCIESLGYVLWEDQRPGRFNRERAIELGVAPGPLFGNLQRGETVRVTRDGVAAEVHPEDVLGDQRPGRKVVYTGDTRPVSHRIMDLAADADLLIHDATFDDQAADRAAEVCHSTAGEAGAAAESLKARMLALVHISSRYTGTANHIRDAGNNYSGEIRLPDDLTMLEIGYRR